MGLKTTPELASAVRITPKLPGTARTILLDLVSGVCDSPLILSCHPHANPGSPGVTTMFPVPLTSLTWVVALLGPLLCPLCSSINQENSHPLFKAFFLMEISWVPPRQNSLLSAGDLVTLLCYIGHLAGPPHFAIIS